MTEQNKRDDKNHESSKRKATREDPTRASNPVEVSMTWLSGLIVIVLIGYLIWAAVQPQSPAAFNVRYEQPEQRGGLYFLPLKVKNTGHKTAQAVQLKVKLEQNGTVADEGAVELDWVPGHSTREATAVLRKDPKAHNVSVEVHGYAEP